ncbi:MAG: hypothetical protein A4E67_02360 [Syntrophaceae bacterium PtaB.Bin038]|nr:MAG: hypothetical protein A4E67_02360 [Syntrophaceae bacterium PtaB.Bin038]
MCLWYHFAKTSRSRSRKSAERSITFLPAATKAGATAMASPCGVAIKITSAIPASSPGEASMKRMSVSPSNRG